MFIRADGKGKNLERVGIRTSDPELASESYRAFSPKSELRIFQWDGSDFLFGFGFERLPHMSLIRFRMRNAGIKMPVLRGIPTDRGNTSQSRSRCAMQLRDLGPRITGQLSPE